MSRAFLHNIDLSRKLEILRDRSDMFVAARAFFQGLGVLEVDCPQITREASIDAHIDLIPVYTGLERRFLHSSPEYGMKRLLSDGMGDIYQISHVFRHGEESEKHNPEFTMAEWYRLGIPFEDMMAETVDFICIFLGRIPYQMISYKQAFLEYVGIDYIHATEKELIDFLITRGVTPYNNIESEGKDALLNLILGSFIEPQLGKDVLTVLAYYPATQAALAKKRIVSDDEIVAERFEVYYQGIELANGYCELVDPIEQRHRLVEANAMRTVLGKDQLPIDEKFLKALGKGLPECCGVAVGFDRLMMLRHGCSISNVIPFAWSDA